MVLPDCETLRQGIPVIRLIVCLLAPFISSTTDSDTMDIAFIYMGE